MPTAAIAEHADPYNGGLTLAHHPWIACTVVLSSVLLFGATATAQEGAEPVEPEAAGEALPEGVEERAIKILGCTVGFDMNQLGKCIDKKIKDVERAAKRAEKALKDQLREAERKRKRLESDWNKQLASAKREADKVSRDLRKVRADLTRRAKAAEKEIGQVGKKLTTATRELDTLRKQLDARIAEATRALDKQLADSRRKAERLTKQLADQFVVELDAEKQIVESLRLLEINPVFRCLAEDARKGAFDLTRSVDQLAKNPATFVQGQMRATLGDVSARFGDVMREELQRLSQGELPHRDEAGARRAVDQLMTFSEPIPGARCAMLAARPQLEDLGDAAFGLARDLEVEMQRVFREEILPALLEGVARETGKLFRQLIGDIDLSTLPTVDELTGEIAGEVPFLEGLVLSEAEMKAIARGVLMKRAIASQMLQGSEALNKITSLIENPGDLAGGFAAVKASALDELRLALQPTQDFERLYMEIGLELLRAVGHKYIDSDEPGHGGHLANQAVGLLQFGDGLIEKIVEALCGLIPEAGAAVCAVVEAGVDGVWTNYIVPGIQWTGQEAVHLAFDRTMDEISGVMSAEGSQQQLRELGGPMAELARQLPHEQVIALWAGSKIQDDMRTLRAHFDSVVSLATAAAGE